MITILVRFGVEWGGSGRHSPRMARNGSTTGTICLYKIALPKATVLHTLGFQVRDMQVRLVHITLEYAVPLVSKWP